MVRVAHLSFAFSLSLIAAPAFAQNAPDPVTAPAAPMSESGSDPSSTIDAYGGPWSAPTFTITPAGALPTGSVRAILGVEGQSRIQARDAIRPLFAVSAGLGRGFTIELGSRWLGGENRDVNSHAPHLLARWQIFGPRTGDGLTGSVALRFKWVGFTGREPELEASYTMQYRTRKFDLGGEAVFGFGLAEEERDAELRAYAMGRVLRWLSVGVSGQARVDLSDEDGDRPPSTGPGYDLRGGATASVTVDRYQVSMVAGASNYLLPTGTGISPFGQLMVAARFN